jgi:FHS family Na+ dependent glucose MFS transporter 1
MNAMHCCFGVGALMAPIIVAQITSLGGLATHSYFILAAAVLPIAGLILKQPSPSGTVREEVVAQTNENPLVFGLALFLLLYVGAEVGFAGWIYSYVITTRPGEIATAAYLTSLFWGSLTLGRALAIPIAARVKPETLLTGSLFGALLSLVLMLLIEHSMLRVFIATAGLGLSMASIFPSTLSFAGRRMRISGKTTGWFVVGSSLGATSIPLAIGQLLNLIGPRAVIMIPALTLLLAGAVFTVIKSKLRIFNHGFSERNEN